MRLLYYILLFILIFPNVFATPNLTIQNKYTLNDTVNASQFGVKADFDRISGTDNRKYLQNAIDYASKYNKYLILPKGKILINSYGKKKEDVNHSNILQLKSNLCLIGRNSEIIIGCRTSSPGRL
ncbi:MULTISPECIES: hypothetical protein [unclassified Empedobacter]|uniref:hypothetical protein n=1 Tax=unclassified Empedobacter TaxID=2643773 RepID=UPI0025C6F8F3|nr:MULTISPECIES: hypothetical protein [unclassified Empedobacter]